jgi:Vitamin K-dependent gamma-carboxylase
MNWAKSVLKFLFPIRPASALIILRTGLGLAVVFFCWSFSSPWSQTFASQGNILIHRELAEAIAAYGNHLIPRLGWLVSLGGWSGVTEKPVLLASYAILLGSGACLVFGFLPRIAALIAWFLHLAAVTSAGPATYGVDQFMTIGLFYLVVAPVPATGIVHRKPLRRVPRDAWVFGFFQRVLQLHLCFIYLFGGLAKCFGVGWWNGDNMWRALTRPPFDQIPVDILLTWSALFPVLGIAVCVIETCYPIFMWPKITRDVWLLLVVGMHCAIGLMMGMYLFGFVMIVLNLAAFGPGSRWELGLRLFRPRVRWKFTANHRSIGGASDGHLNCAQISENSAKTALYCARELF